MGQVRRERRAHPTHAGGLGSVMATTRRLHGLKVETSQVFKTCEVCDCQWQRQLKLHLQEHKTRPVAGFVLAQVK